MRRISGTRALGGCTVRLNEGGAQHGGLWLQEEMVLLLGSGWTTTRTDAPVKDSRLGLCWFFQGGATPARVGIVVLGGYAVR